MGLKKFIIIFSALIVILLSVSSSVFELDQKILFATLSFILFVFVFIYLFRTKTKLEFTLSETLLIVTLFILPIFSYYKFVTFTEVCIIFSGVIFYFTVSRLFSSNEKRLFLNFIVILGIFHSLIGFFEYFMCAVFPKSVIAYYFVKKAFINGTRISSFFRYPNTFAGFLLVPFFVSMYILHGVDGKRKKFFLYIASAFILFVIYLASSRGSYIVLLISLFFIFIFSKQSRKALLFEYGTVFLLSAVFYMINYKLFEPSIYTNYERVKTLLKFFGGESNQSLYDRIVLAKDSMNIFIHHPLFGTGLGTFKDAMLKYRVNLFFAREPHSILFKIIAESGIIGLVSLLGFFFQKIRDGIRKSPYLTIALSSLLFHSFLDLDFAYPLVVVMIFIGLALTDADINGCIFSISNRKNLYAAVIVGAIVVFILVPNFISAVYLKAGNYVFSKGYTNKAISYYNISVKLQPSDAETHSKIALAYKKEAYSSECKKYLDKAIGEYGTASELNKLSFIYPLYKARLLLLKKDPASVALFKKSLELNPLWKPLFSEIALSESYTGTSLRDAVKLAKESLSFNAPLTAYESLNYITPNEKNSIAYTSLGYVFFDEKFFDKALLSDPENGFAYLGKYFTESDKLLKIENLRKAIDVSPCLEQARKLYFANAPLPKVQYVRLTSERSIKMGLRITHNEKLVYKIKVYVIFGGDKVLVSEFSGAERELKFSIPPEVSGKFRIKIEILDKNNFVISGIISPEFDAGR